MGYILSIEQENNLINEYKDNLIPNCTKLAIKYNISKDVIYYLFDKYNVSKLNPGNRKYTLNKSYFDKIDTEDKAYFLGLMYADGYNCENRDRFTITLQERDRDILEKLSKCINSNKPLYLIKYKNRPTWQKHLMMTIISKQLSQNLVKLGCWQKKSLNLKFPTPEQVPNRLLRHFVRGYVDGDGHISKDEIALWSSYNFCIKFSQILKSMQINSSVDRRKNIHRLRILGGKSKRRDFLNWIYKDSTIYLDRKYKTYKDNLV